MYIKCNVCTYVDKYRRQNYSYTKTGKKVFKMNLFKISST